eukprot:scaffold328316_cov23-Prasinocladus_malaysianus.AAC.2
MTASSALDIAVLACASGTVHLIWLRDSLLWRMFESLSACLACGCTTMVDLRQPSCHDGGCGKLE